MKRRGFTLVELLGVFVILSIIVLICTPIVKNSYEKFKGKLSDEQLNSLQNIGRIWGTRNTDKLSESADYYLTIEELKRSGLAENKDIVDPNTKEELKGCIKIHYENNKYNYAYDTYDIEGCH